MASSTMLTSRGSSYDFPLLFEIGWEVANKSGGIYTVLRSKVPVTAEEYGERYCLIGPYMANAAAVEFEELPPPKPFAEPLKKMLSQGVGLHFGRWLVPGNPHALLFDIGKSWSRIDGWRAYALSRIHCRLLMYVREYREKTGIDCHPGDKETNDAILFGFLVAWFLREVYHEVHTRKIICHFHEVLLSRCFSVRDLRFPMLSGWLLLG